MVGHRHSDLSLFHDPKIGLCFLVGTNLGVNSTMSTLNWRTGFFRAWVMGSVIWAICWSTLVLPGSGETVKLANMSDIELLSQLEECKMPPGSPPLPKGFYLDDCLKRLKLDGRVLERWGGGDTLIEQSFRVAHALLPTFALLLAPPLFILLFGVSIAWVFSGFLSRRSLPG
jgi:hypothetical protein